MRAAAIALLAFAAGPAFADGADDFNTNCGGCHSLDASSPVAPSLKGVVGRKIASLPDFQYSDALKAKGGSWTDASLNAFLADPKAFAPGTTMLVSVPDPAERKTIIDYLRTVK
jgi:cytochrome c